MSRFNSERKFIMEIKELLQGIQDCSCGKQHLCPIEHVVIGPNALQSLESICDKYNRILMVSDQNTYRVCGKEVADILGDKIITNIIFETGNVPALITIS